MIYWEHWRLSVGQPAPGLHLLLLTLRVGVGGGVGGRPAQGWQSSWEGRADVPTGALGELTFPLFTFSAQALPYMGMAMTTSSQACTVPAFQWDMGVVRTSSTCCSRSTCSSPSDRLRLCLVGLHWLSESATQKRTGPSWVRGPGWGCRGRGRTGCAPESAFPDAGGGRDVFSPRISSFKNQMAFVLFCHPSPITREIYARTPEIRVLKT